MNTKALIVKVKINKPGQTEADEDITAEVHNIHAMSEDAGAYTRRLYPRDAFKEVLAVEGKVRRYHKSQQGKRLILSSLGWICPAPHVEEYRTKIGEMEAEFYPAVDAIVDRWPKIIIAARAMHGDRFNIENYPFQSRVREEFVFRFIPTPLPNPSTIGDLDFLCGERVAEVQMRMQNELDRAGRDGAQQAMAQVLAYVDRISTTLSKPDPTIHDKLIENLREVLDLAPGLNLAGDPEVNDLIRTCRTKLLAAPEALRESALQRRMVAAAAKNITSTFGQMGGRKLAA
ncbi:MAG: hypothetical protein WCF18_01630 [Chthoniobacteraceae bacterium]